MIKSNRKKLLKSLFLIGNRRNKKLRNYLGKYILNVILCNRGAEEAFVVHNIFKKLLFFLLKLQDFFFNRIFDNQFIDEDWLGLPNPVRAVNCLLFNCRIPPWVKENTIICST